MAERRTEALVARGRFQSFLTEQPREGVCSRHVPATFGRKFTLIALPVVKTRQICHPSLTCTRQSREEFGGEKASFSVPTPPSNSPSASHRPATKSPLGKRRSGAKTRRNLSAEKREEPFAFLRLFSLASADRSRVRDRPVRGTGTLPDAGGAGGGGHAPCRPRPCDGQGSIYADRAPRGYCLLNIRFNM